jgi:apolipoprotein N-acyltransferase
MYPPHFSDPEFLQRSENYWFYGIVLSCMCYGLNFALSLSCMRLLFPQLRSLSKRNCPLNVVYPNSEWRGLYLLGFVFLLFGFATASMTPVVIVGKGAFNGTMYLPGGPAQYLVEHVFQNVTTLRVAYVVSILCHICTSIHLVSNSTPPSSNLTLTISPSLDKNVSHSAEIFSGRILLS